MRALHKAKNFNEKSIFWLRNALVYDEKKKIIEIKKMTDFMFKKKHQTINSYLNNVKNFTYFSDEFALLLY